MLVLDCGTATYLIRCFTYGSHKYQKTRQRPLQEMHLLPAFFDFLSSPNKTILPCLAMNSPYRLKFQTLKAKP